MAGLPHLFTEAEAVAYLGLTPATLARIRRAKQIRHIVIADRRYRYTERNLLDYIMRNSTGPKQLVRDREPPELTYEQRHPQAKFPQPRKF